MRQIAFSWQQSGVLESTIKRIAEQLGPEIKRVQDAWGTGYKTDYASLGLPDDQALLETIRHMVAQKLQLKPTLLLVIGVGGSLLGARAVHHAVHGSKLPVYFLDTLDSWYCAQIYRVCQGLLQEGHTILITVISKSGTTTETIANAQLFIALLAQYKKPYNEYVVAITDEGSPLWQAAQAHKMSCLAVPKLVGGRYSIFSAVGLFPLAIAGLDIDALREGARSTKARCTANTMPHNEAAVSAAILYEQYRTGYTMHDTFLFSRPLRALGDWYRQLVGESLGKANDRQGNRVNVGITPTISMGPEDLHSVAQLYLGGPYNRITTFISAPCDDAPFVPSGTPFDKLVPMIQGKSYATIMSAIEKGTQKAYEHEKRPFMKITFPEISAYTIGQYLQIKMVETIYLGFLFDVNPFDQPQVELYKQETRKIVMHE